MTSATGPARRLLAAFCLLAESWLAADKVRCEIHGGRFAEGELERESLNAPEVRAGCLAVAESVADTGGAILLDLRMVAVVIGRRTAKGEPDGAQAARLATRIAFELARGQEGPDSRGLWQPACFSAAELGLDPDRAGPDEPRWGDIGDPREVRAANLYSVRIGKKPAAMWAVTWAQQFRALPQDFDIELPAPAGIPDTVLSGRAPEIGPGHEGDYEQAVPGPRGGGA